MSIGIFVIFRDCFIRILALFPCLWLLSGCVAHMPEQNVSLVKTKTTETVKKPYLSPVKPQTLMISSDRRYPLIMGSLIRFDPQMIKGVAMQSGDLKQHYQWLENQLSSLLSYRGFVVANSPSASLYFAAALYHPPLQSNTDPLNQIYRANTQPVTQRQSLSLLLRIYRRGALDPLWQGAVNDYATYLPDGHLSFEKTKSRDLMISLLRMIPMTVNRH
ncbi:MAG: hypothetical protein CENE_03521 [Candidatus Celerinatantimonas neptuna]|nr:MAG: hypothetical protein CENE_03521 [Candidatus Celerinatantimonas neptuna]